MKKESFETLIKEKDVKYSDRWKPTTINNIENKLNQGCLINMEDGIKKNIAYNIQYLEYIHVQLKELELSSTIRTSLFKNFIIIGSSIIEAIFYSIIKENKMNTKSNLKEICSTKSNPTKNGSQQVVVESIIYKVVEEYDLEMTYDSMIKKN